MFCGLSAGWEVVLYDDGSVSFVPRKMSVTVKSPIHVASRLIPSQSSTWRFTDRTSVINLQGLINAGLAELVLTFVQGLRILEGVQANGALIFTIILKCKQICSDRSILRRHIL